MDLSFLGKGMKFPPQINEATGRFVVSSGVESIRESLYLILMTQVSERVMRPDFGSNLMSYTFIDINQSNVSLIVRTIQEQILSQEPRVTDITVDVDAVSRPGTVLFDIGYTIIGTNVRDNFVFPFYLNNNEEEAEMEEAEAEEFEPEVVEEIEG
ncbi:MAG: GPW/gp25 family protein [Lachnospiraceae bacterium]|nr:GPW/gp25 family protein [Lachnospiraceae bacterium]